MTVSAGRAAEWRARAHAALTRREAIFDELETETDPERAALLRRSLEDERARFETALQTAGRYMRFRPRSAA
jgi:hypothetical protein